MTVLSSPFIKRRIFAACRSPTPKAIRPTTGRCSGESQLVKRSADPVAQRAATEERPVRASKIPQTRQPKVAAMGVIARRAPAPVATPFPPENPRKIEKQWPENAVNATIATNTCADASEKCQKFVAKKVGMYPFEMSSRSTGVAIFQLVTRATLVAPILPLPAVLNSTSPPKRVVASNPKGMAAKK
jgi:hypothetical protein